MVKSPTHATTRYANEHINSNKNALRNCTFNVLVTKQSFHLISMLPLTKRTLNDGGDTVLVSIHQCEFNSKSYGCSFIAAPKNMKRFNLGVEERRPKYYYDSEDDSGNDDEANNSR